jgi:acyl-CoA synthetase (AMP-forming)/AMP-acid ligase II
VTGALAANLQRALATSGSELRDPAGARWLGADLISHAQGVAGRLRDADVGSHEPVHLAIGNRPLDIASMLGVWLAGAAAVPIHASTLPVTRQALAAKTGARFLIDGAELQRLGEVPPAARPLLRGTALVIFTSGTTGSPKGVVIGHDALAGKIAVLKDLLGLRVDDTILIPLQLNFIFGLWICLLAIECGSKIVLVPKFAAETLATCLDDGGTVLGAVPTMLRALLAGPPPQARQLRMILAGGEVMTPDLNKAISATWPGAGIHDLYGSTETGSCDFCLGREHQIAGRGSIGHPTRDVKFRIRTLDGDLARDGEAGELEIASPYGMLGYLDDPELTRTSFNDGYFRSGDLARIRADLRTEIVGRSKEIISRGGNKISPLQIDNVLSAHPDVAAALCTGVPDQRFGENVQAMVVLKPGASLTAADLLAWASDKIERFKLPDAIHFCDAIPVGSTGKASRAAVRQFILAETGKSARP